MKRWITPFVISLLITGCVTGSTKSSSPPTVTATRVTTTTKTPVTLQTPATTPTPTATRAPTTAVPSCSIDDEARELVREWDRVSAELFASHMDISVGAEEYVAHSERLMPKLNRIVRDLRYLPECLIADERVLFEPFLQTYNDKLSGYLALETAVRLGSTEMQETAIEILRSAKAESVGMACEMARITGERLPGADAC